MKSIISGKYFLNYFNSSEYLPLNGSLIISSSDKPPDFVLDILCERNIKTIKLSNELLNHFNNLRIPLTYVINYLCCRGIIEGGHLDRVNILPTNPNNITLDSLKLLEKFSRLLNNENINQFLCMSDQVYDLLFGYHGQSLTYHLKLSTMPSNFRKLISLICEKYSNIKEITLSDFITSLKSLSIQFLKENIITVWNCIKELEKNETLQLSKIRSIPIVPYRSSSTQIGVTSYDKSSLLMYRSKFLPIEPILNKLNIYLVKEEHQFNRLLGKNDQISKLLDYLQKVNLLLDSDEIDKLRIFLVESIQQTSLSKDEISIFYNLPIHMHWKDICVDYEKIDQYEIPGFKLIKVNELSKYKGIVNYIPTKQIYKGEKQIYRFYLIPNISSFELNVSIEIIKKILNLYGNHYTDDGALKKLKFIPSENGVYSTPDSFYVLGPLERELLKNFEPSKILNQSLDGLTGYLSKFGLTFKLSDVQMLLVFFPNQDSIETYQTFMDYLNQRGENIGDSLIGYLKDIPFIPSREFDTYDGFGSNESKISLSECALSTYKDCLFTVKTPIKKISQIQLIWLDGELVPKENIFYNSPNPHLDFKPYFFITKLKQEHLFKFLKLKDKPDLNDFIRLIKSIQDTYDKKIIYIDHSCLPQEFIDLGYSALHNKISENTASKLNIIKLSQLIQREVAFDHSFGQKEDLVDRLKQILHDYKVEVFLNEMVQNAHDAGSTEVKLILDCNSLKQQFLKENPEISSACKDLPSYFESSLLFYNNSVFTEKDIKNVQVMTGSIKKQDENSIGHHGLGINSMYSFSDCPCILSGEYLMVFDPFVTHIDDGIFNGTIVRLPLRKTLNDDRFISPQKWNEANVLDYLKRVKASNLENLMFFTNIDSLEVSILPVESKKLEQLISIEKKSSFSLITNQYINLMNIPTQASEYTFTIITSEKSKINEKYIICQVIEEDFKNPSEYPDNKALKFLSIYHNEKRKPVGGVAFKLPGFSLPEYKFTPKSFCFLPYKDLISNIPVHIHANFSTTSSRDILENAKSSNLYNIEEILSKKVEQVMQQSDSFQLCWNQLITFPIFIHYHGVQIKEYPKDTFYAELSFLSNPYSASILKCISHIGFNVNVCPFKIHFSLKSLPNWLTEYTISNALK
ncbi:hypothetical protein ACTFIY_011484 [Dictyostelium cf. discoideum]